MSTPHRIAGQPTWLLSRAHNRAQGILFAAFAEAGVRGYQVRLLFALDEHGPSSQADLGRATGIDRSDVVAALDDLVRDGYTLREPDPLDRRRNVVSVTDSGQRLIARLDVVLDEVQEAVLEPLDAKERKAFLRLLAKLS